MNGEGGNDYVFVGLGNDTVNGGEGSDTVSYGYSQQLVALDLEGGYAISEGYDTLISVENAWGGAYNDVLLGSSVANELVGMGGHDRIEGRAGDDRLRGDAGNDTLDGGEGQDEIWGGAGDDVMTGGAGYDWFNFTAWSDFYRIDTMTDFQQGFDKIDVSGIDARPDLSGNQAFTFDATPDGGWEEWFDGLDDIDGIVSDATLGDGLRSDDRRRAGRDRVPPRRRLYLHLSLVERRSHRCGDPPGRHPPSLRGGLRPVSLACPSPQRGDEDACAQAGRNCFPRNGVVCGWNGYRQSLRAVG